MSKSPVQLSTSDSLNPIQQSLFYKVYFNVDIKNHHLIAHKTISIIIKKNLHFHPFYDKVSLYKSNTQRKDQSQTQHINVKKRFLRCHIDLFSLFLVLLFTT